LCATQVGTLKGRATYRSQILIKCRYRTVRYAVNHQSSSTIAQQCSERLPPGTGRCPAAIRGDGTTASSQVISELCRYPTVLYVPINQWCPSLACRNEKDPAHITMEQQLSAWVRICDTEHWRIVYPSTDSFECCVAAIVWKKN